VGVIDVAYRVCPEVSIETSLEDSYLAYQWVLGHADELNVDVERIVMFGESAGTVHATDVTVRARKNSNPVSQLFLVVPSIRKPDPESPSAKANGFGYGLYWEQLIWYYETSVNSSDGSRESFNILDQGMEFFPETTILSAEYDPLLDDAVILHDTLLKKNIKSTYHMAKNYMHATFVVKWDLYQDILKRVLRKSS